jgi:hypothetical protein
VSPLDVERLPSTQPAFVLGLPSGSDCIKLGSLGERHAGGQLRIAVLAIEVFRSDSAFGSWKASTMAMICPAPAPELGVSPDRLQAGLNGAWRQASRCGAGDLWLAVSQVADHLHDEWRGSVASGMSHCRSNGGANTADAYCERECHAGSQYAQSPGPRRTSVAGSLRAACASPQARKPHCPQAVPEQACMAGQVRGRVRPRQDGSSGILIAYVIGGLLRPPGWCL